MKRMQKRILAAVSLHHACNDASVVTLPAIFPVLYTEGILIDRYSDIGMISMAGLIVAVLFQLLIGHNARSRDYRYLLALDALLVGIALLFMTQARNFYMLLACYIGVRMGTSIYHPVGISWISKAFKGPGLDRSMGFQSAFGDIGVLVAFTSTGLLAHHFGWRAPVILWGSVNLLAVAAGLIISRGTVPEAPEIEEEKGVSWKETIRSVRIFIPLIVLGGLAWGVTLNYAPSLLNHKLHIPMSTTGIILGCWMAGGTVATLLYGRIAEWLGRSRTIGIAYSMIIAASLTLGLSTFVPLTIAVFIIYGVSLFITYPALLSFVGSTVSDRNRTAAFSIVANLQIIGNSTFAFISGFLSDAYGIQTPFLMLGGITFLVVIYMLIILAKGLIREDVRVKVERPKDIISG
jgi:MFS family permease